VAEEITVKWPKLNLTSTLERVSRAFVRTMRTFVTQQKAIDFGPVAKLAASTLAARKRRGNDSEERLRDTGKLLEDGFKETVKPLSLTLALRNAKHPGSKATYAEIGAYNQLSHPDHNTRTTTHNWFGVTQAEATWSSDLVLAEAVSQIRKGAVFKGKLKVNLKF